MHWFNLQTRAASLFGRVLSNITHSRNWPLKKTVSGTLNLITSWTSTGSNNLKHLDYWVMMWVMMTLTSWMVEMDLPLCDWLLQLSSKGKSLEWPCRQKMVMRPLLLNMHGHNKLVCFTDRSEKFNIWLGKEIYSVYKKLTFIWPISCH